MRIIHYYSKVFTGVLRRVVGDALRSSASPSPTTPSPTVRFPVTDLREAPALCSNVRGGRCVSAEKVMDFVRGYLAVLDVGATVRCYNAERSARKASFHGEGRAFWEAWYGRPLAELRLFDVQDSAALFDRLCREIAAADAGAADAAAR